MCLTDEKTANRYKCTCAFVRTVILSKGPVGKLCVSVFPAAPPPGTRLQLKRDCAPARSSAAQLSSAQSGSEPPSLLPTKHGFPVLIPHLPSCVIVGPVRGAHS